MKDVLEIMRIAQETEKKSRMFYLEASEKSKSILVSAVLRSLADDEADHERIIERYYNAMSKSQHWPVYEEDKIETADKRIEKILEDTGKHIEKDPSFDGVYRAACEKEKATRDFYKQEADKSDDIQLKKFYSFLANLESIHAKMLDLLVEEVNT